MKINLLTVPVLLMLCINLYAQNRVNSVRVTIEGVSHAPSKEEVLDILNDKVPSIIEKMRKTGIDPIDLFQKQ